MTLYALTDGNDIAAAVAQLYEAFDAGAEPLERGVGYQGGTSPAKIRWYPDFKFWAMLDSESLPNRYWFAFGTDDPLASAMLNIACEINPPRQGIDRRCAGLFVRSDNETVYLAHSGDVGGGRRGIGKTQFLEFYGDGSLDTVHWPDHQRWDYIIIGALDDPDLRRCTADFVHSVARFKCEAVRR